MVVWSISCIDPVALLGSRGSCVRAFISQNVFEFLSSVVVIATIFVSFVGVRNE